MWQQLVDRQTEWVGGTLVDFGDSQDRAIFPDELPARTRIVEFELTPTQFNVRGENFSCGGGREYLGIVGTPRFPIDGNGLAIEGYGGHEFHILKPKE